MKYIITALLLSHCLIARAQLDSIYDQGRYRTFILHLPTGYSSNEKYPVVINMHGLNSNAAEQQIYSQFDATANAQGLIVAYPNAINKSWSLFDDLDVNFISNLVDTLKSRFSANNCLFFTGMSDGGFMSYKLACDLPRPITAIASVTGNMTTILQFSCPNEGGIPVMDFHGTADAVVPYNGTFGIPPIENTIQYWVEKNETDPIPDSLHLPDINMSDGSTVVRYRYSNGINGSKVIFYKIINGGHTWPGTFPVQTLGNTNQDISASTLIGEFFSSFCTTATSTTTSQQKFSNQLFPNPTNGLITVRMDGKVFDLKVYDMTGILLQSWSDVHHEIIIDVSQYNTKAVIVECIVGGKSVSLNKVVITH